MKIRKKVYSVVLLWSLKHSTFINVNAVSIIYYVKEFNISHQALMQINITITSKTHNEIIRKKDTGVLTQVLQNALFLVMSKIKI